MPGTRPGVQPRRAGAAGLVQHVAHVVGHNVQLRGLKRVEIRAAGLL